MANFTSAEQAACTRIFDRLVTPSGSKIAHGADDLAQYSTLDKTNVLTILRILSNPDRRILRSVTVPQEEAGSPVYEIFHDILAKPILDWCKQWQLEAKHTADLRELEEAAKRERLELQAKAAQERAVAAQKRFRRTLIAASLMGFFLITTISAAVFAIHQRNVASQNFRIALDVASNLVIEADRLRYLGASVESIKNILKKSEELFAVLSAIKDNSPELMYHQATMAVAFADTFATLGDTAKQMEWAQKAVYIMENLVAKEPYNLPWQSNLALSYSKLGDVLQVQGNVREALNAYRTGLAIMERLAQQDPSNARWQRYLDKVKTKLNR